MIKPYYSTILLAGLSAFVSVSYADFDAVRADFLNPPQDAKLGGTSPQMQSQRRELPPTLKP